MMPKILALDLGTKTGVAWNFGEMPGAATKTLATPKEVAQWRKERLDRRCDPRVTRLYSWLAAADAPDIVVFEDVEFQTYTYQTQLWSAFRSALWLAFHMRSLIECVPVTTLKKFATGSGQADKARMRKALFTRFPQTRPDLDDNAVDALWILKWAETNLCRATKIT